MVIVVPGNVIEDRTKIVISKDDSERTSLIVTVSTRNTRTTSEGNDQRSGIIHSGGLLVAASRVELIKDLGARGLVDSDVSSVKFARIREIDGFLVDLVDFNVVEAGVDRVGFATSGHVGKGESETATEKKG